MIKKHCLRLGLMFTILMNSIGMYGQYYISGTVMENSLQPVPYAFVLLENKPDSTIILQTVLADSLGNYELSADDISNVLIKATAVGYEDQVIGIATMDDNIKIDFILKEQEHALDDVTITARKPLFEHKVDRMIFNVAQSTGAIGGTALDAIRKAPGIIVRDQDNSISLAGKSSMAIMINGRPIQLAGEDLFIYLQTIPADNIESIEIITAPPAKYDAAGNTGIINIVMKRTVRPGINGSARLIYEQAFYAKGNLGTDLSYHNDRLDIYGNLNYSEGANNITERLNTLYPEQVFRVTDNYKRILHPLGYNLGATYKLHKGGVLGLQWLSANTFRANEGRTDIDIINSDLGIPDSSLLTNSYSTVKGNNNILNLNYGYSIDSSGKKITLEINRLWFDSRRKNDFTTVKDYDRFVASVPTGSRNKSYGSQDIDILTIQADMDFPYKGFAFSAGGKLMFTSNLSDNHFGFYENKIYTEDTVVTNFFDYSEYVQALYINARKTYGKLSLQGGLRGEFTQTKGHSLNRDQINVNRYFNLFPTVYIQYLADEDHSMSFNYSKRILRPDYRSLDPFRAYTTPYHYNEGNPFLLPSFSHNLELSYTYHSNYSLAVFYQHALNHFGAVWFADPVNKVTSGISMNFADLIVRGMNLSASFQPLKWWQVQVEGSLQQQQLKSKIYTTVEQSYSQLMYYIGLNNSFILNNTRTLIGELNVFFLSRYREDFMQIEPLGSTDLGIKWLLFNEKIAVALNGSDILATQKAKGRHIVSGQTINNYFDTRNIRLSVSYKFGSTKINERAEQKTGMEEERQRTD